MVQPHASKRDYETALTGLQFPASFSAILRKARDHGGIDREVYEVLRRLPDRQFESLNDLYQHIRAVYAADGVPPDLMPV